MLIEIKYTAMRSFSILQYSFERIQIFFFNGDVAFLDKIYRQSISH